MLIFEKGRLSDKTVFTRLADIGCRIVKDDKAKSTRMCRSCLRLLPVALGGGAR